MARKYLALASDAAIERALARKVAAVAPMLPDDVRAATVEAIAYQLAHDLPLARSTERTERPERRNRTVMVRNGGTTGKARTLALTGHVTGAERRAMFHRCSCEGACDCVESYPALDGAPIAGTPADHRAELAVAADDASREYWAARIAARDAGLSRSQRRRARRAGR